MELNSSDETYEVISNFSKFPSGNGSENFNHSNNIMKHVEKYTVPVICLLGLISNTLSLAVFLQKSMRTKSCSLFLAARCISDNGFLVTLLIIWTSSVFELQLSRIVGLCQVVIFLTYVFGCQSVWLVVFVTAENYVRVCKPFMVTDVCKPTNAKYAMLVSFICIVACYNFPLWTMTVECMPYAKHMNFINVMVFFDTVVTLIIPTIIMSGLMIVISLSLCKRQRRLSAVNSTNKAKSPMTKVTTMLLAVTLMFFVLNMPSHVVRLRLMIIAVIKDHIDVTTPLDLTIRSFSQLMYYVSLAINFSVYYIFGSKFRETLKITMCFQKSNVFTNTNQSEFYLSNMVTDTKCDRVQRKDKVLNSEEFRTELLNKYVQCTDSDMNEIQ